MRTRITVIALVLSFVVGSGTAFGVGPFQARSSKTNSSGQTVNQPFPHVQYPTTTSTSFSDGELPDADWQLASIPGASSPGATFTGQHVAAGGNAGGFWSTQIQFSNPGSFRLAYLLNGQTYNPATEGPIAAISGEYDLKILTPGPNIPAACALLLYQNNTYYIGPASTPTIARWIRFTHKGLTAANFVRIAGTGSQYPDMTCNGKEIQVGFLLNSAVLPQNAASLPISSQTGIDNWLIRFESTCCQRSPRESALHEIKGRSALNERPARSCDDEAAPLGSDGNVIFPDNLDPDSPPVYEEVDQVVGNVKDLYPGIDTSTANWFKNFPGQPSIGGTIPPQGSDAEIKKAIAEQLADIGIEAATPKEIVDHLDGVEKSMANKAALEPPPFSGNLRIAGPYTPPSQPHVPIVNNTPGATPEKYVFGGRDIVFVHGLKLDHIIDEIVGKTGASTHWKWNKNPNLPGNLLNQQFYDEGYYWDTAFKTWETHIKRFLTDRGIKNRYMIVTYPCNDRAEIGAAIILKQIADAMQFGIGVVDPVANDTTKFGTPSYVMVSHSTGGLVTNIALTAASTKPTLGVDFVANYCKGRVAVQSAFVGSRLATAALAASAFVAVGPKSPAWLLPLGTLALKALSESENFLPPTVIPLAVMSRSILVDLVPAVAQLKWSGYAKQVPVRTLTVVAGHPSFIGPAKVVLHPGYDDGVVTINSQVGNPSPVLLWPSGFAAGPLGLVKNFDRGVFRVFPLRAIDYYTDQVFDARVSPGAALAFPPPLLASGAVPYLSPTGMLQDIAVEYSQGNGYSPLDRFPNHFSFIQSTADHFSGTHDRYVGFNGPYYANTPAAWLKNVGERNMEESLAITSNAVYTQYPMPYPNDDQPLLRPENVPGVEQIVRGRRVGFTIKIFKKKISKHWWIWRRYYFLLNGWDDKVQFDYVYESVLKD